MDIREYIEKGKKLISEGKNEEGEKLLKEAMELEPDNLEVAEILGDFYYEGKKYSEAERYYEKIVGLTDLTVESYVIHMQTYQKLGEVYEYQEKYEDAIRCYRYIAKKAIDDGITNEQLKDIYCTFLGNKRDIIVNDELDISRGEGYLIEQINGKKENIDDVELYLELGNQYSLKEDYENATRCYKKVLELEPNNLEGNENLGVISWNLEKYDDFERYYKKIIEIEPAYIDGYNELGNLYFESEEYEEALRYYKEVENMDPLYDEVCKKIATIYKTLGDEEKYKEYIEKDEDIRGSLSEREIRKTLEKTNGELNDGVFYGGVMAKLYLDSKNYYESLYYYKKNLELDYRRFDRYLQIGDIYMKLKRYNKAIEYLKKGLEINPYFAPFYNTLGNISNLRKDYEKSVQYFKKFIELEPNDMKGYYNLGIAYYELERYNDSIDMFKKGIEISPDFSAGYNNLGLAYNKIGETDKAIENYKKALKYDKNDEVAHNNLAHLYKEIGNYEEAKKHYKKVIEINPHLDTKYDLDNPYSELEELEKLTKDENNSNSWLKIGLVIILMVVAFIIYRKIQ